MSSLDKQETNNLYKRNIYEEVIHKSVKNRFFINFQIFNFFENFKILKFHFLSIRGLISKFPGVRETKNDLKIVQKYV